MSHSLERQPPLKTGAARIVLGAEAERSLLGVRLVPVGLRYDAKDRFRSRVAVHVGAPLDPAPEAVVYRERPGEAVRALTGRIGTGLEAAVAQAAEESREGSATCDAAPLRPLLRLLTLPVLVMGCVLNWLPYRLPGWVSGRLSRSPEDPATYKLLTGLLVFPLAWAAEAALAARLGGSAWGLAMAVIAPASGYVALRLREKRSAA
jgi:hypothetical protein